MKDRHLDNMKNTYTVESVGGDIIRQSKGCGNSVENIISEREISSVIESLPTRNKEIMNRYLSGYKYREIADMMGMPIGTVKFFLS